MTGGVHGAGSDVLTTTEVLTVGDATWRSVGSLPVALTGIYHAGVSLDNTVLITGNIHITHTLSKIRIQLFRWISGSWCWIYRPNVYI